MTNNLMVAIFFHGKFKDMVRGLVPRDVPNLGPAVISLREFNSQDLIGWRVVVFNPAGGKKNGTVFAWVMV